MPPDEGATPTPTGDGGTPGGGATPTPTGDEGTKLLEAFKAAGIEDPGKALETIQKLRPFERGEVLPKKVQRELDDLRAKVKENEDAKLSEGERLSGRVAELEAELAKRDDSLKTLSLEREFGAAAAKAGALYPDDVSKLVDASKVERDDAGKPTNLDALVEELKASRPALFGRSAPPSFDGGARTPAPGSGPGMEELLRGAAGH
jgi:hypothetical protein